MKQTSGTVATSRTKEGREERVSAAPPPHFTEIISPNPGIDFLRWAPFAIIGTWLFILAGLAGVWYHGGLNYGIDFAGGTLVQVRFAKPTSVADVRAALGRPDLKEVVVQDVGPKVGKDLWRQATLAVLFATLMMATYIAFRFDLRFGVGAAVALIHDVLFTVAALSIAHMEFDLTTVAGLLTVVGFSVHDTVIISDRIRENLRKLRKESLASLINLSVNETLSRTIITNGTAITVTGALFLLGGSTIHSFAFTLLIGFIVGTYSSIYIASPVVLFMERWRGGSR